MYDGCDNMYVVAGKNGRGLTTGQRKAESALQLVCHTSKQKQKNQSVPFGDPTNWVLHLGDHPVVYKNIIRHQNSVKPIHVWEAPLLSVNMHSATIYQMRCKQKMQSSFTHQLTAVIQSNSHVAEHRLHNVETRVHPPDDPIAYVLRSLLQQWQYTKN